MTEYIAPEERTYEQMMEIAKAISPAARVRAIDFGEQKWEIYIPSEFVPTYELPESYMGTPAWAFAQSYDGTYGNELSRWGYKNGDGSLPIEAHADYYNLQTTFGIRQRKISEERNRAAGLVPMNEVTDWESVTKEMMKQYKEHRNHAEDVVREDYVKELKVLNEKWDR